MSMKVQSSAISENFLFEPLEEGFDPLDVAFASLESRNATSPSGVAELLDSVQLCEPKNLKWTEDLDHKLKMTIQSFNLQNEKPAFSNPWEDYDFLYVSKIQNQFPMFKRNAIRDRWVEHLNPFIYSKKVTKEEHRDFIKNLIGKLDPSKIQKEIKIEEDGLLKYYTLNAIKNCIDSLNREKARPLKRKVSSIFADWIPPSLEKQREIVEELKKQKLRTNLSDEGLV